MATSPEVPTISAASTWSQARREGRYWAIEGLSPPPPQGRELDYYRGAVLSSINTGTRAFLVAIIFAPSPVDAGAGAVLTETVVGEGVTERFLLNALTGFVSYERHLGDAWHAAAHFVFDDEDESLVLAELKVFADLARTRAVPKPLGTVKVKRDEMLSIGWIVPGVWDQANKRVEGVPAGGMTARLLRSISFSEIQHRVNELVNEFTTAVPDFSALRGPISRPGRSGRSDGYYALWAARYAAATSSSPNVEIAEDLGIRPSQVRDFVREARRRGLLSGQGQGREGGTLTDKARALLAQAVPEESTPEGEWLTMLRTPSSVGPALRERR